MRVADAIVNRRKEIIVAWIIAVIAITPAILGYTKFISYTSNSSILENSQSSFVQKLVSQKQNQNSSISILVQLNSSINSYANRTLMFQQALARSKVPYLSSTDSVFTSYASFINIIAQNYTQPVRTLYSELNKSAWFTYGFASYYLSYWKQYNYSSSYINEAIQLANKSYPVSTKFLSIFTSVLSSQPSLDPVIAVNNAARAAALQTSSGIEMQFTAISAKYLNVADFRTSLIDEATQVISLLSKQSISRELVLSLVSSDDPGYYYVSHFGITGIPSFLLQRYVSSDNSTMVVYVYFNVTESFRGSNNFYPAQNATPQIRQIASKYFSNGLFVTGQGAIAYDSQQLSSSSSFVFGLTFLFLAVAVAITLGSLISPILAMIFVSISTAIGYLSIYITGLIFGSVDFTVTYTLTAVLLGVTTDYVVFLLSRYKEELKEGKSKDEAIKVSIRRAGEAVVISGITVSGSLGALSFIPDLRTWGPVLLFSVILTVILVVTLLPSISYILGSRIFLKSSLSSKTEVSKGWIYRLANFSSSRNKVVALVIIASFIPSFYFWATLPTTYNISEGLPSGLESVKGLNLIDQKFGSDLIFPIFVVSTFPAPITYQNGSLTAQSMNQLNSIASKIMALQGVGEVIGPYGNASSSSLQLSQFMINRTMVYYIVLLNQEPYSEAALNTVTQLRSEGFLVGGLSASVLDLKAYYSTAFTLLEVAIVIVIAIVLGISLRSYLFPLISLSGVMVSITWTTFLLYFISKFILKQEIVFLVPVVLFVILMSLGNDFTVFILTRVKEEISKIGKQEGLLRAMAGSGSVVTSLGLILAVSLGSLAIVPFGFLEQVGIAFAISLILDTFVIRTLYFPAMISFLVKSNETKN